MRKATSGIRAIDVGSFPLEADLIRYEQGASFLEVDSASGQAEALYFIEKHNGAFLKKAEAMGPSKSVTSFAQGRGMITQFLKPLFSVVTGIKERGAHDLITKSNAQIVAAAIAMKEVSLDAIPTKIAEVTALERKAKQLSESLGVDVVSYKACITGPLELTLNLQRLAGFPRSYDERLMDFFTDLMVEYVKNTTTSSKHLQLHVFSMDDPSFGLEGLGNFFTDTETDELLQHLVSCWNRIYGNMPKDCYHGLHIHTSPYENIFKANWDLLEAHVGVYVNPSWMRESNKFIRAAVLRTDGPMFPKDADLKAAWGEIHAGNYEMYLQSAQDMRRLLDEYIKLYGRERVPFAGPECGLGPWDWKNGADMALANLQTVSMVLAQQ